MLHTTPGDGLSGPPWIERLRPALGARSRDSPPAPPLTIEIGTATGAGPTPVAAFDAALRALGVGDANLIRLSSVIPPGALVRRGHRVAAPITWGDRLYCVYAVAHAEVPGATAAAGVGWVLREEPDGGGLFVEHEGECGARVEELIGDSLADMTAHRPYAFGPVRSAVAQVRCEGDPVCAVALAAYQASGWERDR